jgi:uncharacterized protein (TIGR03435 family)
MDVEEAGMIVATLQRGRNFMAVAIACAGMMLAAPAGFAQAGVAAAAAPSSGVAASPAPVFDVATIKPHQPDPRPMGGGGWVRNTPDGIKGMGVTVTSLVRSAYGLLLDTQVTGGPDWTRSERYDVEAKMSAEDIAAMQQLNSAEKKVRSEQMLQALLAERFNLKTHSEIRQEPVYELVVAKGGAKMKDAATDPNPPLGKRADGKPRFGMNFTKDTSIVQAESMESFAAFLSTPGFSIGRPLLNKTGLTGTYDFALNWSVYSRSARPKPAEGASDPADEGAFLSEALKEIGLNLHPAKGGIEYIVIDHVEKPSAN